jgi:hypothetical protein
MGKSKFSRRAERHAAESKMRTRRMMKGARQKSGPVTISYLPGMEPAPALKMQGQTKFPFLATINGEKVWVSRGAYGIQFD